MFVLRGFNVANAIALPAFVSNYFHAKGGVNVEEAVFATLFKPMLTMMCINLFLWYPIGRLADSVPLKT